MRIGELADQVGVNPKTVRYYEQIGTDPARAAHLRRVPRVHRHRCCTAHVHQDRPAPWALARGGRRDPSAARARRTPMRLRPRRHPSAAAQHRQAHRRAARTAQGVARAAPGGRRHIRGRRRHLPNHRACQGRYDGGPLARPAAEAPRTTRGVPTRSDCFPHMARLGPGATVGRRGTAPALGRGREVSRPASRLTALRADVRRPRRHAGPVAVHPATVCQVIPVHP